jgi:hypothetical protein
MMRTIECSGWCGDYYPSQPPLTPWVTSADGSCPHCGRTRGETCVLFRRS